ncbi:MAG: carboxypeptidase-like regulatory domain-containing protein [bacterium]|nr:carboxypeptidase-like regulatory domain-containing protein [bacterium]
MRGPAIFLLLSIIASVADVAPFTPSNPEIVIEVAAEGEQPSLTGEVLDGADQCPLIGAQVTLTRRDPGTEDDVSYHKPDFIAQTGAQGRFSIGDIPPGPYLMNCETGEYTPLTPIMFTIEAGSRYTCRILLDYDAGLIDRRPNLYLYPEATAEIAVQLLLPASAALLTADPPYADGWLVTVTPEGRINDTCDYLYYEVRLPEIETPAHCWIVPAADREGSFREILTGCGFIGREIEDFIEWWIPRLDHPGDYVVRPLVDDRVDALYTLDISPAPDSLRRVVFLIEEVPPGVKIDISSPVIPPVAREGFTVVEWGVIL